MFKQKSKASEVNDNSSKNITPTQEPMISLHIRITEKILIAVLGLLLSYQGSNFVLGTNKFPEEPPTQPTPIKK